MQRVPRAAVPSDDEALAQWLLERWARKEELLVKECQAPQEFIPNDYEIAVPVNEYSYNDINREIMEQPESLPFVDFEKRKLKKNTV